MCVGGERGEGGGAVESLGAKRAKPKPDWEPDYDPGGQEGGCGELVESL